MPPTKKKTKTAAALKAPNSKKKMSMAAKMGKMAKMAKMPDRKTATALLAGAAVLSAAGVAIARSRRKK
jgi:hypothetical protein